MGTHRPRRRPQGRDLTEEHWVDVTLIDPSLSHLGRAFTYTVPEGLDVEVGAVVRVPFRRRKRTGVVTARDVPAVDGALPLTQTLGPGLGPGAVELAAWVADRYLSTHGEALAATAPTRVVSEEGDAASGGAAAVLDPLDPDLTWLQAYGSGDALARALAQGTAGGFVLRPRVDEPRAPAIVAIVGAALARGSGALVLVPEVRAGGEVAAALREAFGDAVALLGSDRAARARYRAWLSLRSGVARIALGGRGASFAPVPDLGLVVMDDEAQASYKEGRAPRFHARTVAAERARRAGVPLVLVGVPPSIEAREACDTGGFTLVAPERAAERAARPPVTVIHREPGERLVPSAASLRVGARAIGAGRRVVVLVHRGGDSLAHAAERSVRILAPSSHAILSAGVNATELRRAARTAALIVATPVIAKDLIVAGLGALIIAEADAALTQPSFRASEEVFGTWWRAASWIGDGHVAVETTDPAQPAIVAFARWDPEVLFAAEAERRRELRYPPYATVARIDVPSSRGADVVAEIAAQAPAMEVLGPVIEDDSAVIVVRAQRRVDLLGALRPLADRWRAADEPMRIDVDPWEVLVPKWRS